MIKNAYHIWTGGIKDYDSGKYVWDDGSPFKFNFWRFDQPDEDDNKSNPVAIVMSYSDFQWWDDPKSTKYYALCKI